MNDRRQNDTLRAIIDDTAHELSAFLPDVRQRILRRIQAAYCIGLMEGINDGGKPARMADKRRA